MKKNILLAVVGAVALTGCVDNEVMKERGYIPAPKDDAEITATAPKSGNAPAAFEPGNDAPAAQTRSEAQTKPAGATGEFPPMTDKFSGEKGISDDGCPAGAGAKGGEYIVKRGDTLGKIASAHRVKLSALMKANNLTDKDAKKLRIGQKLTIPAGGKAAKQAAKAERKGGKKSVGAGNAAAAKPSIQPGEYIVKSGDTPEKIARRAGVKLSALMEANNLTEAEARRLRIGQKLTIPENGKAAKQAAKTETEQPAAEAPKPAEKNDTLSAELGSAELKAPAAGTAPAAQPAQTAPAAPAAVETTEVVMTTSDISIADFARQNGTTVEELRKLNTDIGNSDMLKAGEPVLIPKK